MKKKKQNNSEFEVVEDKNITSSFYKSSSEKILKEKIKKSENERKEYLDGWQRERATVANLKKLHKEERKLFVDIGKENLIQEIFPVLDSFDAAFSNKEAWEKVDSAWRSGVEYIYNQLKEVLEHNGVAQFGEEGNEFNDKKYLLIENEETNDKEKNGKISKIIQKGYRKGDKILREAKVKIWKKK